MTHDPDQECGICGRPLGTTDVQFHHLIPKTFKGTVTVPLHKICHQKAHATFTERELLSFYHTLERIRDHEIMKKFIMWVRKKPPEFYDKNDRANRKKKR